MKERLERTWSQGQSRARDTASGSCLVAMAHQLPGMRWDHEKQRYFPLVSRQAPTQRQPDPTRIPAVPAPVAIKRRRGLLTSYHALADLRTVCRTVRKDALIQLVVPPVRFR